MRNFKRILAIVLVVMMVVPMMTTGLSAATAENTYVYSNTGTEVAGGNWKAFVTCDFSGAYGPDFALYDLNGLVTVDSEGQMVLYNTIQKDFAGTPFVTPAGRNVLQSTNTTAIDNLFMQFGFMPSGNNGAYPLNFSIAFSETQLQGALTADSYTVENGFAVEDNGMVKDGLVINMYRTSVPANADPSYEVITAYVMENGKVISSQSFDIDNQGKDFGLTVGHPMRTFFTFDDAGVFTYHVEDSYSADGAYINQTYAFDELDMSTINATEKMYYFSVGTGDYWNAASSAGLNINLARVGTVIDDGDGTFSVEGETKNLADWTGFGVASCEHVWGEYVVVSAPTCTDAGILEAACQNGCGATDVKTVPANGHAWGDWTVTVEPDCTNPGSKDRVCGTCGAEESQTVAANGHDWSDWYTTVEADCVNDGMEQKDCAVCGSYEEQIVPALGHTWVWDVLPDYTTTGARHCEACDAVETDLVYDAEYYWTFASNNNVGAIDESLAEYNNEYVVNVDDTIELQDLSLAFAGDYNYNTLLKATSEFATEISGFWATVENVTEGYEGTALEGQYPTVLSFLWTTEKENYDGANEFSTSVNAGSLSCSGTAESSRYGHLWNNYVAGKEYSVNIILSDGCLFWGSTWYGELDDGEYDWIYYAVISRGNFWNLKMVQPSPAISAFEPITVSVFQEMDFTANKLGLFGDVNGFLFDFGDLAGSQTADKNYYFSVAAYGDGMNAATASFRITDVCGQTPALFNGFEHECYDIDPDTAEVAASCTTEGAHLCAVCQEVIEVIPAIGYHTWNDATCTDPKTCSVCGETEGEALGHNFVDFVCTVCGATEGVALVNDKAYATLDAAIAAANDGDTIKLLAGVSGKVTYTFNKNVNLDLNGFTLRHTSGNTVVVDGATVTLVGAKGTIRSSDGISVTVVNGGSFVMDVPATIRCSSEEGFNVFSIDATSSVVINALGGRFYKDPTAVGATLADGLAISGEGTNWTVIEAPVEPEPEVKDYVITFDPDGGVMPEGTLLELPINYNENYKEAAGYDYPVPTLEAGYVFAGWYWEAYNYTLYKGDWDTGYYAVQDSITLVALYEECAHTNMSEWTVTVEPQVGVAGEQTSTCLDCGYVAVEEIPALDPPAKDYTIRLFLDEYDVELGAKINGVDGTEILIPINMNEDYNDAYGDFPTASLEGYKFAGWFLEAYGFMMTEGEWNGGSYAVPGDCELYAIFEECAHTNMSEWTVTVEPQVGVAGEQTATCLDCGYVVVEEIPALDPPAKAYTITFDPDGGVMPEGALLVLPIDYMDNYKEAAGYEYPVPTLEVGYKFAGWYWEMYNFTLTQGDWDNGYYAVQMSIDVIALWEECAHTNMSEWTVTVEPQVGVAGEQTATCLDCGYVAVEEIPALDPPAKAYTITFDPDGGVMPEGTLLELPIDYMDNYKEAAGYDYPVPTLEVGYKFAGWFLEAYSFVLTKGDWDGGYYALNGDCTLVALYEECAHTNMSDWTVTVEPQVGVAGEQTATCLDCGYVAVEEIPALVPTYDYKITFDPDGGVMPEGVELEYGINYQDNYKEATGIDYPVPTMDGYKFAGWYWELYNYVLDEGTWNGGYFAVQMDVPLVALWEEAPEVTVVAVDNTITVYNIDSSVKDIWVAAGALDNYADVKANMLYRVKGDSAKVATGTWAYTVPENGTYTVYVRYNDGTVEAKVFVVDCNDGAVPNFVQDGATVTFNNLDDLYVLRYVAGEYDTSYAIKRAPGVKNIKTRDLVNGSFSVTLEPGTYSFVTQFNDGNFVYYTVVVENPTPVYPERAHTITFDPDGGVMPAGTVTVLPIDANQNYKEAAGYDYPVPTLEGYVFGGWYWEEYNYTLTQGDWDSGYYAINWSIEVIALWQEA